MWDQEAGNDITKVQLFWITKKKKNCTDTPTEQNVCHMRRLNAVLCVLFELFCGQKPPKKKKHYQLQNSSHNKWACSGRQWYLVPEGVKKVTQTNFSRPPGE